MLKHLIRRLARPTLDDPDPERRRQAVLRLDPVVERARLRQQARSDADDRVRQACIKRMLDAADLLAFCDDENLQAAAYQRLGHLIETGQLDPLSMATDSLSQNTCRHLLLVTQQPAHWQPLLATVDSERTLAELAIQHSAAPLRLAAAQQVRSEGALRRIERAGRERDKAVAQLMRERLDNLRQLRQELERLDHTSDRLLADLKHLANHQEDPQTEARLAWLDEQYAEMLKARAALDPELARFSLDLPPAPDSTLEFVNERRRLAKKIDALQQARAAERAAAAARAEQHRQQEAVVQSMEALWAQMAERLDGHAAPASELTALRAALSLERQRWQAVSQDPTPATELVERQQVVASRLQQLLDALTGLDQLPPPPNPETFTDLATARALLTQIEQQLRALQWPAEIPEPAAVSDLREILPALQARTQTLAERANARQNKARDRLKRLEQALAEGNLRDAMRQLGSARKEIEATDDSALQARLARARARLEELQDWRRFATADKRENLIEAMQALAAEPSIDPLARAERVRTLREQWNGLGSVTSAEQPLQQQFDTAAETAFAPSRVHFEAQAATQAANAEQQRRLCSELETFLHDYDWSQADWLAVVKIYQQARQEWRRFQDVSADQNEGPRYHALMRELRSHLAPQWKQNLTRKRELVAAARALAEDADAPVQVRRLQADWNRVGITPVGEDRKLRRAFRDACQQALKAAQSLRPESLDQTGTEPGTETTNRSPDQPMGALQLALLDLQDERQDTKPE